jgi:hypothetical protein
MRLVIFSLEVYAWGTRTCGAERGYDVFVCFNGHRHRQWLRWNAASVTLFLQVVAGVRAVDQDRYVAESTAPKSPSSGGLKSNRTPLGGAEDAASCSQGFSRGAIGTRSFA